MHSSDGVRSLTIALAVLRSLKSGAIVEVAMTGSSIPVGPGLAAALACEGALSASSEELLVSQEDR